MLLPHPESDLSLSIFVLGSEIVSTLRGNSEFLLVETILIDFLKRGEERTPDLFFDVLTFLFTVGILEYKGYKMRLKKHDTTAPSLF